MLLKLTVCVCFVLQGGKKVVCGDGEGTLLLYHWGLWGDCTDRYPAHSDPVDSLLAIGDSILCTGSSDGTVRYMMQAVVTLYQMYLLCVCVCVCVCDNIVIFRSIQILPNDILGVVGHHPPGLPIDNMCLTHDGTYLVTGSQDVCKFWSVDSIPTLPSPCGASQPSRGAAAGEEGDSDGWSKRKKRKRKLKHRQLPNPKDNSSDFFSDLCS